MKVTVSPTHPFRLLVTSYGRTAEAGPRILRGGIHPDICWVHDDLAAAQSDAQKLQTYLDDINRTSKVSKRALRAFGA